MLAFTPPAFLDDALVFAQTHGWFVGLVISVIVYTIFYQIVPKNHPIWKPSDPLYTIPYGLTAAEAGFLIYMQYTPSLFVATVYQAAVNRYLSLSFNKAKVASRITVTVKNLNKTAAENEAFLKQLADGLSSFNLGKSAPANLNATLQHGLTVELLGKKYFPRGPGLLWLSLLLFAFVILFGALCAIFDQQPFVGIAIFMMGLTIFFESLLLPSLQNLDIPKLRKMQTDLLAFKMFLSAGLVERSKFVNAPPLTPQLFEQYLPYAIAFRVAKDWMDACHDVVAKAIADKSFTPSFTFEGWSESDNKRSYYKVIAFTQLFKDPAVKQAPDEEDEDDDDDDDDYATDPVIYEDSDVDVGYDED